MEKRLILVIGLSLLILLGWSALISKLYPPANTVVTEKIERLPLSSPSQIITPLPAPEPSVTISFPRPKMEFLFREDAAAIQKVIFKDYQSHVFPLQYGGLFGDKPLFFKKERVTESSVEFLYKDGYKQIIKRFIFSNSNYSIELEIEVQNLSSASLSANLPLVLGVLNFSGDQTQARFQDTIFASPEKTLRISPRKDFSVEGVKFVGLRDRYFCAIVEPGQGNYTGFIKKIKPQEYEIGLVAKELQLEPGQKIKRSFRIYLGPQDLKLISSLNPDWAAILYYGTFDFISHFILQILVFLHSFLHNWGSAIVVLSILIYIVLFPLSLKQMRSMKEMQALQPAIEELRKTYKDNPQKLNREIMALYRKHKANPFSGCLPLVLQIPIFFALYQAMMRTVALKGAHFLWIKDLSEPDRFLILPVSLPVLGNEINLLPILMAIGMFIQQKMSTGAVSSGSAEQQRIMLILFPLMFGFIFYHMPAGLVLYWFLNSSFMLIYQVRLKQKR